MTVKYYLEIAVGISIQLSRDLAYTLGFDKSVKYSQNTTLTRVQSRIDGTIHFVYCDILEHVAVGHMRAPLLRIVDNPRKSYGNIHRILNPIL